MGKGAGPAKSASTSKGRIDLIPPQKTAAETSAIEVATSAEEDENADGKREKLPPKRARKKSRKELDIEAGEGLEGSEFSDSGKRDGASSEEEGEEEPVRKTKAKKGTKVKKPPKEVVEIPSDNEPDDEIKEVELIVPRRIPRKGESSEDVYLIFDKATAMVKTMKNGKTDQKSGHKETEAEKMKGAAYAGFLSGSTTTLRRHIASYHYELYAQRCAEAGIPENDAAVPKKVLEARQKIKPDPKQRSLDGVYGPAAAKVTFSTGALVHDIAVHIVCDDQAISLANATSFRNCLVRMRGQTTPKELPTGKIISSYINNAFIDYITSLQKTFRSNTGRVSTTDDLWTRPYTSAPVLGVTAHWVEIGPEGKWSLKAAIIGMGVVRGKHNGVNLAAHLWAVYSRVEIVTNSINNLGLRTADNTSSNPKAAKALARTTKKKALPREFNAKEDNLGCYSHITNLGSEAVMEVLTKTSVIETTSAIWEFDPTAKDNRILDGKIDVISAIRTLSVKIQASGQRKQFFAEVQRQQARDCTPLIIPLHNNTRWGSAQKMCERALLLREAIDVMLALADKKFGPITTVRGKSRPKKDIPWTAFRLDDDDWKRVLLIFNILNDANAIQHVFAADKQPTLYRILPAVQQLLTAWKAKATNPTYAAYVPAIEAGISKIEKYSSRIDSVPANVMALVLHPYYNVTYFLMCFGEEGRKKAYDLVLKYMESYWPDRLHQKEPEVSQAEGSTHPAKAADAYATFREAQLQGGNHGAGEELNRYAGAPAFGVGPDTDPVEWWSQHQYIYPTLARIALDVLPAQASSVPTERSFSSGKETATPKRNRLGDDVFEQTQILKYGWKASIYDYSAINAAFRQEESADYVDAEMAAEAEALLEQDKGAGEMSDDDDDDDSSSISSLAPDDGVV